MTKVTYEIVEHDGGWAYKLGAVYSETFPSHEEALNAANRAAAEQRIGGETEGISYQDAKGTWHDELSEGGDRPETEVSDQT